MSPRNLIGAALVAAGVLMLASQCHAFQPYPRHERVNKGAVVVDIVDDYSLGLGCMWDYTRIYRNPFEPIAVLGTPECAIVTRDYCVIRTMPSDFLLGHAFRHCVEGEFHVPFAPGLDLPPPSLRPATGGGGLGDRQ